MTVVQAVIKELLRDDPSFRLSEQDIEGQINGVLNHLRERSISRHRQGYGAQARACRAIIRIIEWSLEH